MKILHVINSLTAGGAERLLVDLSIEAKKKNTEFEILMLTSENNFEESLIKNNIKYTVCPYNNKYDIRNIIFIKSMMKKFDIIHSHLFPSNYYVAVAKLISRKSMCKIFTTEHSTSNSRRKYKFFKYLEKFIYSFYFKIICISNGVKRSLVDWGIDIRKTIIISNGVNLNNFNNRFIDLLKYNTILENNKKMILMVGSFKKAKDQKTLIRAMKYINNKAYLVLAGDGILKKQCEELVKELKLEDRVKFIGNRTDIENIISISDIGVLSSHYEGFGISAVECMAAGKPTLGTNVEGLSEIIDEDLLFRVGDYTNLADKINKLIEDEKYYNIKSKQCRKIAEKFNIKNVLDNIISEYKN